MGRGGGGGGRWELKTPLQIREIHKLLAILETSIFHQSCCEN